MDELGFVWDPEEGAWVKQLAALDGLLARVGLQVGPSRRKLLGNRGRGAKGRAYRFYDVGMYWSRHPLLPWSLLATIINNGVGIRVCFDVKYACPGGEQQLPLVRQWKEAGLLQGLLSRWSEARPVPPGVVCIWPSAFGL